MVGYNQNPAAAIIVNDLKADRQLLSSVLAQTGLEAERIGGGRNSRVYRVRMPDGGLYAAKIYHRQPNDRRDRLAVEFAALRFLWDSGIRAVPRPIKVVPELNVAIYQFVAGAPAGDNEVTPGDIDACLAFLISLDALKSRPGAQDLRPASEACFTLEDLAENLHLRLARLRGALVTDETDQAMRAFLARRLEPFMAQALGRAGAIYRENGLDTRRELALDYRTLSPSDFGFHNAIHREDGSLIFLDFEYFGWDDPAKLTADFLLHPGMSVPEELRNRLAMGILEHFRRDPGVTKRLDAMYPLFAVKWTLILLNEFLPAELSRRAFAAKHYVDKRSLRRNQLEKAAAMLDKATQAHETIRCLH
jgi:hypothetical protein